MDSDWTQILLRIGGGVIGGLLTVGFLRYLMRDSSSELLFREMKYGRKLHIFATVFMLFAFALTISGLLIEGQEMWVVSLVGAGLMLIAGGLMLEVFKLSIRYDETAIAAVSAWRSDRRIPWDSIVGYTYSEANQWHEFDTNEYGKLRVSTFLVGIQSFFEFVATRRPDLFD